MSHFFSVFFRTFLPHPRHRPFLFQPLCQSLDNYTTRPQRPWVQGVGANLVMEGAGPMVGAPDRGVQRQLASSWFCLSCGIKPSILRLVLSHAHFSSLFCGSVCAHILFSSHMKRLSSPRQTVSSLHSRLQLPSSLCSPARTSVSLQPSSQHPPLCRLNRTESLSQSAGNFRCIFTCRLGLPRMRISKF